MAVAINTDKAFQAEAPRRLFDITGWLTRPDVTADGKRFLFGLPEGANVQTPFMVVLNWQAALKR
jgi:hypothetical protein